VSNDPFAARPAPVPASEVRIESVGVNPLDRRRVDVAVDLTPCLEPLDVEIVVVGPDDDELCSALMIRNRQWMLDRILHLRRDAEAGEYVLHIGVFREKELLTRAMRTFLYPSFEKG
jgi:hypothetical protein